MVYNTNMLPCNLTLNDSKVHPICFQCTLSQLNFRERDFRAQRVACGYSQVPGIDFQERFAPLMNNITLRILLIIMLAWN
jgi:hypothetical protein